MIRCERNFNVRRRQRKPVLHRHRDDAPHLGDAREGEPFAGRIMGRLRHVLHLGAVHTRWHGVARFHHGDERRTASIGGLLAEKAEKRSQEEKKGKPTFHEANMVGRGRVGVNDYPP